MGQGHLDHLDAEQLALRILVGRQRRAPRELVGRADRGRARHVDVDVRRIARVGHDRMRVRPAAGLHGGDGLRVRDVADVEDADAAHPVFADRIGHALRAAIETAVEVLPGHEQEIAVDRDVILRVGADVGRDQCGAARLRDVPNLQTVEVALDDVVPRESEIRVQVAEVARRGRRERCRRRRRGDEPQVPGRRRGVHPPGGETDARVGAGRCGGHVELRGRGAGRDNEQADRVQHGRGSHWWLR